MKGNKKRAKKILQELQENFVIPKNDEELRVYKKVIKDQLQHGIQEVSEPKSIPVRSEIEKNSLSVRSRSKTKDKKASMLFGDYMSYWLESHKHNVSLSTYASYESQISSRIKPYFNERGIHLGDLTSEDIQEFYNQCMDGTLGHGIGKISPNTVIHYHANIRLALEYARRKRWVQINEADLVTRPKKKQFIGSFYNEEELEKMLDIFKDTKLEFAVMMAAYYGLRRSEVVGLQWKNIDFERKVITIAHTVTEFTLKGKRIESANDKTKSKKKLPVLAVDS